MPAQIGSAKAVDNLSIEAGLRIVLPLDCAVPVELHQFTSNAFRLS